jgi:hypothetical protein
VKEVHAALPAKPAYDVTATFDGEYGKLRPDWSRLAMRDDAIVGALLVVERASRHDTPTCPFIIELFTARTSRTRASPALC